MQLHCQILIRDGRSQSLGCTSLSFCNPSDRYAAPAVAVVLSRRSWQTLCINRASQLSRSIRAMKILLATIVFLAVAGLAVAGQNKISGGAIIGRILDPSAAAVGAARVTVINNETGLQFQTVTSSDGLYNFPLLRVGVYTLRVYSTGFKSIEVRGVSVEIAQTATTDIQLELGTFSQLVVVEAAALSVRPSDSSVTTVVSRDFIEDLPLSGRRYTDFVLLAPNVVADGDSGHVSIGGQQGSSQSGYHNGNGANSFTVDGANSTSGFS